MQGRVANTLAALAGALLILAFQCSFGQSTAGEKRVALVVGNSAYKNTSTLPNPRRDAQAIAAALRRVGFDVDVRIDVDKRGFDDALRRFGDRLEGASAAVFFYAGHGLQVDGRNYLLPVDTRLEKPRDLPYETVDLSIVLREMEATRRINLVFLDACRDNPLSRSLASTGGTRSVSVGRGLAPVDAATGTLISYATKDGSVAADGGGRNSPFTAALLSQIEQPGLEVGLMLRRVRENVIAATNNQQVPWEYGSLLGEFYFRPGGKAASAAPSSTAPPAPQTDPVALELEFWGNVKESRNPDELRAYLEQFPNGKFTALAHARIKSLTAAPPVQVATAPSSIQTVSPSTTQSNVGPAAGRATIGILHSLSGTMAISEGILKDVALMAVEEINASGGILGKKIDAVVVDPASNWPLFAQRARQLLAQNKVDVVFGCWTSVSRKSVLPVFEELNGLLFYPVQYEGEESSRNVFYTGATPNQQAIPAAEYLMSPEGGSARRFVLLGTDYVYPRTTNKILRAFLRSRGIDDADIREFYTPFGHSDYRSIVADIRKSVAGGRTAVISSIQGDSNVPFYKELQSQGLATRDASVVALSIGEEELRGVDMRPFVGHLAASNYFMSLRNPENEEFKRKWAAYAKRTGHSSAGRPLTTDAMVDTYIGVYLWKMAVERARSFDVDRVRAAMSGQAFRSPSGYTVQMDATNHHLSKPVFIAEMTATGQFNVVWKTTGLVNAEPWSKFIAGNNSR